MKKKTIALCALTGTLAAATAGGFFYTFQSWKHFMGRLDYTPADEDPETPVHLTGEWKQYQETFSEGKRFFLSWPKEEVSIRSYDGLKLTGYLMRPAEGTPVRGCLLMMHGYHGSPSHEFGVIIPFYLQQGFILLLPDERAHGKSEGKSLTFGVKERHDCQMWAEYLAGQYPDLPMFLDGISMGASVVLMASSLPLPKQVRGIIADCGFTSPWEIVRHVMTQDLKLPAYPTMWMSEVVCRVWSGYSLREYSTIEALKRNELPVLFVHGRADSFVPCWMTEVNEAACLAPHRAFYVEKAGHGLSYLIEKDRCEAELVSFFDEYIDKE